MKATKLGVIACSSLALLGCSPMMWKTPEDYKASSFVSKETYEVDHPFKQVADILSKKSTECLKVTVVETKCTRSSCYATNWVYTPVVTTWKDKIRLSVQISFYLDPKEPVTPGNYVVVAEAVPAGNKTKVSVYSRPIGFGMIPNAIKRWTNKTNLGCPNLAEDTHAA